MTWSAPTIGYGGYDYGSDAQHFLPFSAQDIQQTASLLTYLSSIIDLDFTYVASGPSDIRLGYEYMGMNLAGYAYFPPDGRLYLFDGYAGRDLEGAGSFSFMAFIHEFGHLLGLKHPFDDSPVLPDGLDTTYATAMSYNDFQLGNDFAQSYMPLDISALLNIYGAAAGVSHGDFAYRFSETASLTDDGHSAIVNVYAPFYLYDANHAVVLDFSALANASETLTVDLKDLAVTYAPQDGVAYSQYDYSNQSWSGGSSTSPTTHVFNTLISSDTHVADIIGTPFADVIVAGTSSCAIDGGGGDDTVVYSGSVAQYRITERVGADGTTFTIADTMSNRDGATTLAHIEDARFSDGAVDLGTLTASSGIHANFVNDLITDLYVGYFGRAPDPAGESYWVGRLEGGMSLGDIAQSFSVQPESTKLYDFLAHPSAGDAAAVKAFVESVYANLFNRAPDISGENYWIDQLETGASTAGGAILDIIGGAIGDDRAVVSNKAAVGDYYDTQAFSRDAQFSAALAHSALSAVTFDASTVDAAKSMIDSNIKAAPAAGAVALQSEVDLVGSTALHEIVHYA